MSSGEGFDIDRVHELFTKCQREDGAIVMDAYVDAYEELCRLFNLLGTVFGFVTSDVNEKIRILRDYRKSEEADHYETVVGMISYEVENDLTQKKRKHLSGSRTLLRLHRAMEFVTEFMKAIVTMDPSKKLTSVGSDCYSRTLAHHHPWVIRKAVGIAMYTLPTGQSLIGKMGNHEMGQTLKLVTEVTGQTQTIYDRIQSLYATNNLLDLP